MDSLKPQWDAVQQRQAEEHLAAAAAIAHAGGIPLHTLVEVLTMFYQEGDL